MREGRKNSPKDATRIETIQAQKPRNKDKWEMLSIPQVSLYSEMVSNLPTAPTVTVYTLVYTEQEKTESTL